MLNLSHEMKLLEDAVEEQGKVAFKKKTLNIHKVNSDCSIDPVYFVNVLSNVLWYCCI